MPPLCRRCAAAVPPLCRVGPWDGCTVFAWSMQTMDGAIQQFHSLASYLTSTGPCTGCFRMLVVSVSWLCLSFFVAWVREASKRCSRIVYGRYVQL